MLIPITPLHPASVGAGVGVNAVPGLTPGPTTVGMGVSSVEMAPSPLPALCSLAIILQLQRLFAFRILLLRQAWRLLAVV